MHFQKVWLGLKKFKTHSIQIPTVYINEESSPFVIGSLI